MAPPLIVPVLFSPFFFQIFISVPFVFFVYFSSSSSVCWTSIILQALLDSKIFFLEQKIWYPTNHPKILKGDLPPYCDRQMTRKLGATVYFIHRSSVSSSKLGAYVVILRALETLVSFCQDEHNRSADGLLGM